MSKYQTEAGIECTPEECKLIDSLKRLAKKWEKDGKRLWLYSASGSLHVMMHGDTDNNPTPEFTQYGGSNIENSVTTIDGILNDGTKLIDTPLKDEILTLNEVIELKKYYGIKKIIVTHIDEIWGKSYGYYNELEKELDNIVFAYDGMEIIV